MYHSLYSLYNCIIYDAAAGVHINTLFKRTPKGMIMGLLIKLSFTVYVGLYAIIYTAYTIYGTLCLRWPMAYLSQFYQESQDLPQFLCK